VDRVVLLEKVVSAEVKNTIFSMKPNKAPGPDGYTADFYQSSWHIVGDDVVSAVQNLFVTGRLLKEVNATILTLIPKKPNASVMGDFRPIACSNVLYKCITKILSNRMMPVLDSLISRNQFAFIPCRSISENVLLAQELVRNYHRKDDSPRCTMKIDLMKAYDSVDWEFIIVCLKCFGFPTRSTNWIKICITSPSFSISLNGTLVGYFKGGKGLRQGDTLSPYLFVLATEVFSRLMQDYTKEGSGFKFHYRCSRMKLTHLCFADDLLIFSEANVSSISRIKAALKEFEVLSGLKANPSKSYLFCSGVSDQLKLSLLDDLQMKEGHFPVRYLRVPLISSKLSAGDCKGLLEKIAGRIDSWTSKNLSFDGCLQLISFILYSLQVYWSGIFILPMKIIKDINQKFNRFLWNGRDGNIAKAKMASNDLCFPKKEVGLGLKDLKIWNIFSMLRHIWNLFAQSGSIWVAWVQEYLLKGDSFWNVSIPHNSSWCWRKLLKLQTLARSFLRFDVGTGSPIHMWLDNWHPLGVLFDRFGYRVVYDSHSRLKAKLDSVLKEGLWCWRPARFEELVIIQSRLPKIPIGAMDKPVWTISKIGAYTSAESWNHLRKKKNNVIW
jgi:hypothetical protein